MSFPQFILLPSHRAEITVQQCIGSDPPQTQGEATKRSVSTGMVLTFFKRLDDSRALYQHPVTGSFSVVSNIQETPLEVKGN